MREERVLVRVGTGPRDEYELEAVEALGSGASLLVLEAYGDAVCNAVDVALSLAERFGLEVSRVEVGKRRKGSRRRIWVRVTLRRQAPSGGGAL